MLVYGRNVAERIFSDEKLLKKVRKLKIEEKYYLKIKNLLGEFPKSKIKLARKSEIDNLTKDNHQGIIIDMEDYQYTPLNKILESTGFNEYEVLLDNEDDTQSIIYLVSR